MIFKNETGLENLVGIVFELGEKNLTLSSMENLIVECNLDLQSNALPTELFRLTRGPQCRLKKIR